MKKLGVFLLPPGLGYLSIEGSRGVTLAPSPPPSIKFASTHL